MQAIKKGKAIIRQEGEQEPQPPRLITRQTTPVEFAFTSIRSSVTKKQYPRRLKLFFDYIGLPGGSLEEQGQAFLAQARKGGENNNNDQYWAEDNILFFLESQKQRVQEKELAASTLGTFYWAIKTFCDAYKRDLPDIDWKRISKVLPKANLLSNPQALIQEVEAYMSQQGWTPPQDPIHVNMTRVAEGIVKSRYLENSAMVIVVVQRPDCWTGAVMGGDNVQTTRDGCNTGYFSIPCSGFFGSYSLAMQRSNEGDGLPFTVQVWKGGELLKEAQTTADYGIVSFAGSCS